MKITNVLASSLEIFIQLVSSWVCAAVFKNSFGEFNAQPGLGTTGIVKHFLF